MLLGLVSIVPTLAFLCWRKEARADMAYRAAAADWTRAGRFVLIELHLLALIPLAAVVMARGLH